MYLIKIALIFLVLLTISACSQLKKKETTEKCGAWIFAIPLASEFDKEFFRLQSDNETVIDNCRKNQYKDGVPFKSQSKTKFENTLTLVDVSAMRVRRKLILNSLAIGEIEADPNWELMLSPSPLYQFFAKHIERSAGLALSAYDQNPFITWSDTRDAVYLRIKDQLIDFEAGSFKQSVIKGNQVSIVEYRGNDKVSGAPLRFIGANYRIGKKIVYLTLWCFESEYVNNKMEFEHIINSFSLYRVNSSHD